MAESRSRGRSANSQSEPGLEEIAAELYALHPDAFAAARDERVRAARAEGKPALARELSGLRRPTLSAWLINLLWRDQREVMEQLFELANDLNRAQAEGSGASMRELTAQRRAVEAALIRRARGLAEQAGARVADATLREAQETLAAALARPDVAQEVRAGRLVKAASYAGFGVLPATPPAAGASARPSAPVDPERPKVIQLESRAAQRARERREDAERRVAEARASLEAAARTLAARGPAAEQAQEHYKRVDEEVERLRRQLRDLEERLEAARQAARVAERERDQAERVHEASVRALERAQQQLEEITNV